MTEITAAALVDELVDADQERAMAILQEEQTRDAPRVTVVRAAEGRLALLAIPGTPQESTPKGVWAQLLGADGEPLLVDGNPVRAELTRR